MQADLHGVCPIIATPFTSAEQVDQDSLRHLIRSLARGGCHALTLFGIAGEYYKLSETEARRMVAITVEECRKAGVPSILSVTEHATVLAVDQARAWEDAGADVLMLLPPFFLKPGAAHIIDHVIAVAGAVQIPVMLQYAPEQTGVAIAPEALARLTREAPNVRYHKIECKPPGAYISKLLSLASAGISVFIGNAGFQMIEGFDRGARGVMPGCSMYDVYLRIYDLYQTGRRFEAIDLHTSLVGLLNHIRQDVEMIIAFEKRILHRRGLVETSVCRRPGFTSDSSFDRHFEELYERIEPLFASHPEAAGAAAVKGDHLAR